MRKISDFEGLRLKLVVLLLVSALLPITVAGFFTLTEIKEATENVQGRLTNISTSALNRSALVFATSEDTDQVQLAVAKANQYDAIFLRIKSQSEIVANSTYFSPLGQSLPGNVSCDLPVGVWIAPKGNNGTKDQLSTIATLCRASSLLGCIVDQEGLVHQGYIATDNGILVSWPDIDTELKKIKPFDPRVQPFYLEARGAGKTVWTRPHPDLASGAQAVTCATPIYEDGKLVGVVGMDVSLWAISGDLSGILGRGYPFLVDGAGKIIVRPRMDPENVRWTELLAGGIEDVTNPGLRSVLGNMTRGKTGASVVGLKMGDCYIAYAPITSAGWSLGIAFPAEKMQLPAMYIEAGVREVAREATHELDDALRKAEVTILAAILLTGLVLLFTGVYVSRRITQPLQGFVETVDMMGKGEAKRVPRAASGDLGQSLNRMGKNLRNRMDSIEGEAYTRGMAQRDMEIAGEIKDKIAARRIPGAEGYGISVSSTSEGSEGFDFYDVLDIGDDRIALEIAHVSGSRVQAAIIAALSRPMIRALSRGYQDPAIVLQESNMEMSENARGPVACFLAMLDPETHALEYVNAGHTPPFVVSSEGVVDTLIGGGIALGAMDRVDLIPEIRTINPGDILVMYSDGVTDPKNGSKNSFGIEGLISTVKENRQLSPSDILKAVEAKRRSQRRGEALEADSTLIILKREEVTRREDD